MNTSDFGANVFDENQRRLAAGDAKPAPSENRPRKRAARRRKTDEEEPGVPGPDASDPAPADARIDTVPELPPPAFADEAPPPPPFATRSEDAPLVETGPPRGEAVDTTADDRGPSRRRRRRPESKFDVPVADAIAPAPQPDAPDRGSEAPVESAFDHDDAPVADATTELREPAARPESPSDASGGENGGRRRRRRRRRGRRGDRDFVAREDAPRDDVARDRSHPEGAEPDDAPRERSEDGDGDGDEDIRDEREPAARGGEAGVDTDSAADVDVGEVPDRDEPARAPEFRARREFDRERHPRDRREFREREREPQRQAPPQQPRIARAPVHVPTPEGETRGTRIAILIDLSHIQSEAGRLDREIAWGRLVLGLGRGRHLVRSIAYATDDRAARVASTLFGSGIDVNVVANERMVPVAMAVDAMTLASRVDAVVLVPASDDLMPMARALAGQGVRVESADFTTDEPGADALAQAHHRLGAECLFAP